MWPKLTATPILGATDAFHFEVVVSVGRHWPVGLEKS